MIELNKTIELNRVYTVEEWNRLIADTIPPGCKATSVGIYPPLSRNSDNCYISIFYLQNNKATRQEVVSAVDELSSKIEILQTLPIAAEKGLSAVERKTISLKPMLDKLRKQLTQFLNEKE